MAELYAIGFWGTMFLLVRPNRENSWQEWTRAAIGGLLWPIVLPYSWTRRIIRIWRKSWKRR